MSVTLDLRNADADASVLHSASGYHRSNHVALGPALAPGQPVEYRDRDVRGDDAQLHHAHHSFLATILCGHSVS